MIKFRFYDYSFKIGFLLVILAFFAGFLGNKYQSLAFTLNYYQYIYVLVIVFAGINYGMIGGFFTSTSICIIHVIGLVANPAYYKADPIQVNYNIQLLFFTCLGIISGLSYEWMSKYCSNINKSLQEANKKLQASSSAQPAPAATNTVQPMPAHNDSSVKFYNYTYRFSKLISQANSADGITEAVIKTLAADYSIKELAVFSVSERGRKLTGKAKKNLQFIEKIEEFEINFGEGLIGKSASTQKVIVNETADPRTNDWQIAIPLTAHGNLHEVIGVAKLKSISMIGQEDTEYLSRMAELASIALERYSSK
ncbi:MAG: GAF domain-containing protein [Candidatus Wallbacteria bacterium]